MPESVAICVSSAADLRSGAGSIAMRTTWKRLAASFILAAGGSVACGGTFSSMVVFGDSLSDTGNGLHLNSDRPTAPWYDYGRWTNGKALNGEEKLELANTKASGVWHEVLARQFGVDKNGKPNVPAATRSETGGSNWAYGGATTKVGWGWGYRNIGWQINDGYLKTKPTFSDSTLYCMWGGGNDIRDAGWAMIRKRKIDNDPVKAAGAAVANLESYIGKLAKEAGKTRLSVLWPNVPPMHLIPDFAKEDAAAKKALEDASEAFSKKQKDAAAALRKAFPNLNLMLLDIHQLFLDVFNEKIDLGKGFDSKTPILDFSGFTNYKFEPKKNEKVAKDANPDLYLFWDKVHPTAKIHELIGERAFALVPAPGSLWLLAAFGIAAHRRHRAG